MLLVKNAGFGQMWCNPSNAGGGDGNMWSYLAKKKKKASPYLKTLKLGMVVLMLSRQEAEVGG
jgi:hypothetical protein